jgi:hypothetical protein
VEQSRSATSAAGPQTEARRSCGPALCKLVTSARFAKQTARWSRRIRSGLEFVQKIIQLGQFLFLFRCGFRGWRSFVQTLHRNFVREFHFLVSDWQEIVKRRIVLKTI